MPKSTVTIDEDLYDLLRLGIDVARDQVAYLNRGKWIAACARRVRSFEKRDREFLASHAAKAKRAKLRRVK